METIKDYQSFGAALEALRSGKRVTRHGWAGKGLYVFKQVPSPIAPEVVPRMTSLPQDVKDQFQSLGQGPCYRHQLALVHPSGGS